MKTKLLLTAMLAAGLSACNRERQYTDAEIRARLDAQVKDRMAEIRKQAAEDLDQRKAVEIKPKIDSIIAAHAKKHPDTVKH